MKDFEHTGPHAESGQAKFSTECQACELTRLLRRAAEGEDILRDLRRGDAYTGFYVPYYKRAEAARRLAMFGAAADLLESQESRITELENQVHHLAP